MNVMNRSLIIAGLLSCSMMIVILVAVARGPISGTFPLDYRREMRDFIRDISAYAKGIIPNFIIIPQNGYELLTENGRETGPPATTYLDAIDGVGVEGLFYGYRTEDTPTPVSERSRMVSFMDIAESNGIEVLGTDYCLTRSSVGNSYRQNAARGYISFAAEHRELDSIPNYPSNPYNVNSSDITSLAEAKNFLYLINPSSFPDKDAYLDAIRGTNYDVLIIDLFYNDVPLTASEVSSLRLKENGGSRLVIVYMSIGEAEDYRYYWRADWETNPPRGWMGRILNGPAIIRSATGIRIGRISFMGRIILI